MKDKEDKSQQLKTYNYNGKDIYYRTGTSDMVLIYEILLKKGFEAEYYLSKDLNPKVIVDIGSNIGISAVFFANLFPDAKIYTFEPLSLNYDLLVKNTKEYKNIECFNVGLGSEDGSFSIYISDEDSDNYGGASIVNNISENSKEYKCQVRSVKNIFKELNIQNIDFLKIDTEGAEYDIMTSMDNDILQNVQWITGELHGNHDYKLLDYITDLGFNTGMRKEIHNNVFVFHALKDEILNKLSKKEKKNLIR